MTFDTVCVIITTDTDIHMYNDMYNKLDLPNDSILKQQDFIMSKYLQIFLDSIGITIFGKIDKDILLSTTAKLEIQHIKNHPNELDSLLTSNKLLKGRSKI